jgi:hypothetical protein
MEKKGELLNQLAIISDLLEKANVNSESKTVIIELNEIEFTNTFQLIQKKYGRTMDKPDNKFSIRIGDVDFIFNMNNV